MSRLPTVASLAPSLSTTSDDYIFGSISKALTNEKILGTVRYLHSNWDQIPDRHMRIIASLQDFRLRHKGKQSVYGLWPDGVFSLLLFPRWRRAPWETQLVHAYKEARLAKYVHFLICNAVRGGKV